MQTLQNSYRGLKMIVDLNWNFAFFLSAIVLALLAALYLAGSTDAVGHYIG